MYGCQQILISDSAALPYLEFLCGEANKLTNCGIYYARQLFFKTGKIISKFDLNTVCKNNVHFEYMHSQAAQQVLLSVAESFNSYKGLSKAHQQKKIKDCPKLPKYRTKNGLALVAYPKQALKLKDKMIRIPLGIKVKAAFGVDSFKVLIPSNLKFEDVKELRILPRNKCFYLEFVYQVKNVITKLDFDKVLGIDPGLNNLLTCVSNIGKSFILSGRKVKSQNQWYNKQVAELKKGKPQGFWNETLANITEKRNR